MFFRHGSLNINILMKTTSFCDHDVFFGNNSLNIIYISYISYNIPIIIKISRKIHFFWDHFEKCFFAYISENISNKRTFFWDHSKKLILDLNSEYINIFRSYWNNNFLFIQYNIWRTSVYRVRPSYCFLSREACKPKQT